MSSSQVWTQGDRVQIHIDEEPGAVLVFLTGQDEIQSVQRVLEQHAAGMEHPEGLKLQIVGIHASMPPEQQLLAFAPALEVCALDASEPEF